MEITFKLNETQFLADLPELRCQCGWEGKSENLVLPNKDMIPGFCPDCNADGQDIEEIDEKEVTIKAEVTPGGAHERHSFPAEVESVEVNGKTEIPNEALRDLILEQYDKQLNQE